LEEKRGGKKGLRMLKKRGEYEERVKNLEERRGGKKGLTMLKVKQIWRRGRKKKN
jgi:hypothetical protein